MVEKFDIDVSLASRLITSQFPQWTHLPIRPVEPGGWDNKTFHLGDNLSIRLPSAKQYAAQVGKEHLWLPKLAPQLPLPIPIPVAMGKPDMNYPWHWSVYQWLDGENASIDNIANLPLFANTLAQFLSALQEINSATAPAPGKHNFFRGGALATYDRETRDSIAALHDKIDSEAATAVWESALETKWNKTPVWLHGDMAASNMLVKDGDLCAVIDFGCSGVGDPACDLTIAWTLFSGESRKAFRAALPLDNATWARARGWALWKGLVTLVRLANSDPSVADSSRQVIEEVFTEHFKGA